MATKEIAGVSVDVTEDGYLTNPEQWTEAIAAEIAAEEDIASLTDGHWNLIKFLQKDYKEQGTMPTIRRVKNAGGVPIKELYELYPGGPLKKASRIAGLPKPASCV